MDDIKNNMVTLEEFKSNIKLIEKEIGPVNNPEKVFNEISGNNVHFNFSQFCEWSLKMKIAISDHDNCCEGK